MSETSSDIDQGVWVDDYTTSAGVHVAGHWRKRGGRGVPVPEATPAGATVTEGPTYVGVRNGSIRNPEGDVNVIATTRHIDIAQTGTTSTPSASDAGSVPQARAGARGEPRDKVSAGLEALRRRREALGQKNPANSLASDASASSSSSTQACTATSSEDLKTATPISDNKCRTCGQFKAANHTCRPAEGTVVDPTAATAALKATDRYADTTVTEYVPFSGQTCWSVKGPEGNYLVTPTDKIGPTSYLVWKSDQAHGGVREADVSRGINTAARLASSLPAGRPGSAEWQNRVQADLTALPDGGTHTLPVVEGRGGVRYAEPVEITHTETSEGSGVFTITGHDGTSVTETYGPEQHHGAGNPASKELAARMVADQAGQLQQPDRCRACGRYVPLDGTHDCPNPGGVVAGPVVRQLDDVAEDDDTDELDDEPGETEETGAAELDLPEGNYADVKGDERVKAMLADLEDSVKAVVESGQLKEWLDAMASNGMTRWSLNNRLLAMLQMWQRQGHLGGIHLMGFRQWEKHNRKVNKGAKAVWILAPRTRSVTEEDENGIERKRTIITGFKSVPVFNISDTSGEPLAEHPSVHATGEVTPGTIEGLQDRVGRAGYTYKEQEIADYEDGKGTLGYTDPATKEVVIDSRLSKAQKASTIAHELGHIHCGHVDDINEYRRHRGRQESEAEMCAYLVNRQIGGMSKAQASSFSAGYIASWSKGDAKTIHAAMDKAVAASNKILDGDWPTS